MKNDGGPAYPAPSEFYLKEGRGGIAEPVYRTTTGMTLRDYFAGQALVGFAATVPNDIPKEVWLKQRNGLVQDCYELADIMIAQRNKE